MHHEDMKRAANQLRQEGFDVNKPASIEQLAKTVGIDVDAQFSYREVAEMAEYAALSPYITRIWIGEERFYFPSGYKPYATE